MVRIFWFLVTIESSNCILQFFDCSVEIREKLRTLPVIKNKTAALTVLYFLPVYSMPQGNSPGTLLSPLLLLFGKGRQSEVGGGGQRAEKHLT